ncbi:MAG: class II aldolase/adducin family protein [Bacteroidota bacterium]|nr:class II aldolase/adducin family protein [Bacteroidota bacterium]
MLIKNKLIEDFISVCRRMYEKGFVSATDGNVSVRLETGTFLTTRTGVNKGIVSAEDIIEVNRQGEVVSGSYAPSTELAMHLFIYLQRPDVKAVVHAHPPYATGFATARQPLTGCVFPEVIVGLGAIPLAEYATPSTLEVVKAIEPFVKQANAILLANHGVVTYGSDLYDAYYKMEKVEHAAHITFVARMLGGENLLSQQDVEKLKSISKDFSDRLACETSDTCKQSGTPGQTENSEDDLKTYIKKYYL